MQNHYGLVVWLAAGVYENKIDLCGKYPWRNDVLLGGYETYLAPPQSSPAKFFFWRFVSLIVSLQLSLHALRDFCFVCLHVC